jgi:membrane-associated protein
VVERVLRLLHVPRSYLDRMDSYYLRHAGWTVVVARQISPARGLAALSAGGSRVPWRRFAVFNAGACVAWATAVTLLATLFVAHLDALADDLSVAGLSALGLALVVGLVSLWRRVRRGVGRGTADGPRRGDEHRVGADARRDDERHDADGRARRGDERDDSG